MGEQIPPGWLSGIPGNENRAVLAIWRQGTDQGREAAHLMAKTLHLRGGPVPPCPAWVG